MQKETNQERLIIFSYAILVVIMISEPFVFQITNKEQIRMYGYIAFLIGTIVLAHLLGGE